MKNLTCALYIEDDANSRLIMKILLEQLGVSSAYIFEDSNGFEGKIDGLNQTPDIVFLDIHVKPLSGFQMIKIIKGKQKFQGKPIIALTASVMNEEINELRCAGFNGVIAKPIKLEVFPDIIARFMSGEEIWGVTN